MLRADEQAGELCILFAEDSSFLHTGSVSVEGSGAVRVPACLGLMETHIDHLKVVPALCTLPRGLLEWGLGHRDISEDCRLPQTLPREPGTFFPIVKPPL